MRAGEVMPRRLRASRLVGTPFRKVEEVVRHHGAMQAQDYGPAKWSIGQRARGLVDADVDAAVADGSIVRTHVLRPTWHFVAREDVRWLLALTGPLVQRQGARRYRELGLDARTLGRCEQAIASALEGGNRLTRDEIAAVLRRVRIDASGQRLPWILMHCELEALIASGPRSGKHHTYALLDERAPAGPRFDADDATADLVQRYLGSHGPATVRDLRWWSSLPVAAIREALDGLGSEVRSETIDGIELWSLADAPARPATVRGVGLLQPYDELVVGYTESRYFGDPHAARATSAWRDRRLPNGVMLVNGRLGGVWRRTADRNVLNAEVLVYEELAARDAQALASEVARLARFTGIPVEVQTSVL